MKRFPLWGGMGVVISLLLVSAAFGQNDAAWRAGLTEDLRGINESLKRLNDRLDILENNQAALQKECAQLQQDLRTAQQNPAASPREIERIDAALKQLDAARERDKQALVEQVAKMLDDMQKRLTAGNGGAGVPPADRNSRTDGMTRHTVKSGENLTLIAKAHGVTIGEIRKANQLTGDLVRAGQVLVIPKREQVPQ